MALTKVSKELSKDIATARLIGRATAGAGSPEELAVGAGVGLTTALGLYWKPNVVQGKKTDTFSGTSTTFADITGLSAAITPQLATSKVLVRVVLSVSSSGSGERAGFRILRNQPSAGTIISGGDSAGDRRSCHATLRDGMNADDEYTPKTVVMEWLDEPATVSPITYNVAYAMLAAGTLFVNRGSTDTDNTTTPRTVSTITLTEIPV